jgi:hypothetical protein
MKYPVNIKPNACSNTGTIPKPNHIFEASRNLANFSKIKKKIFRKKKEKEEEG